MARTLAEKLYIREGSRIVVIDAPEGYDALLGELPAGVSRSTELDGAFDWVQYFVVKESRLEAGMTASSGG